MVRQRFFQQCFISSIFALGIMLLYGAACSVRDKPIIVNQAPAGFIGTKRNVVILLIDGARYSETFGDTTHQNIPELYSIAQEGAHCNNLYNAAVTNTINGISYITTGQHDTLVNNGNGTPGYENIFQRYIKYYGNAKKACIVASKDKIAALNDCTCASHQQFLAYTNCGVAGNGTGYRDDSTTMQTAIDYLRVHQPQLSLIALKQPDAAGHTGIYADYISSLKQSSKYALALINFLKQDSFYANNTDVIITNDHGRHVDNWLDGFAGHGDTCIGCRHISCIAWGPDFKVNHNDNGYHDQRDITATIGYILKLGTIGSGAVMTNILK
jgi:hypothetical protein